MPIDSINQIMSFSGDVMRSLLIWSGQAFLLLGLVWVVLKFDRSQSPAVRYRIWLIALTAVSAFPLLTALSHSFHLPSAMAPFPVEIIGDAPAFTEILEPTRPPFSWPSLVWPLLFALWAAGVIISLLRLASSLWKLHIIRAGSRPVSMIDLDCSYSDLLNSDTGRVSIVLSKGIQSPGLAGLFHPVILLPADITLWTSRDERTSILRHELAHIKRHDHLVSLFQSVVRAFLFFHPVLRYGCAQLSLEREFACDDHVIGLGTEPKAYAESILKAVERTLLTDIVHQTPSFASRRMLERRIDMILDTNRVRQPLKQWQFLLMPIMLIVCITWLVIPAASSQPGLQGGVTQSAQDGSVSGPTQASPVLDRTTLSIDSVKRGPVVRQVRGLGVLVPSDDGRLKVEVGIFEPQARNIEIGQHASIETGESTIPGKVVRIKNPRVENSVVRVEVALEGDLPGNIKAGLQVDGMIEVERFEDVIYVGRPVRGQADSTSSLFKLEDDGLTAIRVRVKFGRSSATAIEIVAGLKVGDKVILSDMSAYEGVAMIKLN
ncbi:MAG TPA: M56 family metallopeptidase [Blastocatellia bacterium]|nr:M56 family metallopeptidase [Blastocatellia bacterium]